MPVDWIVDEELNLVHMELLHHFEHFTVSTIIFRNIWPRMLQRAFRVGCLPPPSFVFRTYRGYG